MLPETPRLFQKKRIMDGLYKKLETLKQLLQAARTYKDLMAQVKSEYGIEYEFYKKETMGAIVAFIQRDYLITAEDITKKEV